jgi:aspartate kinase
LIGKDKEPGRFHSFTFPLFSFFFFHYSLITMIVMKFGGSSVAGAERLRHVAGIVQTQLERQPVLVLSAMGDTTDHLLEAGEEALRTGKVHFERIEKPHLETIKSLKLPVQEEIKPLLDEVVDLLSGISVTNELTPKARDYLVSFGERLSVRIAAAFFQSTGINAKAFDAWDLGFLSNSNHGQAELSPESWKLIREKIIPLVNSGLVPVITGFIARDGQGYITTLGRGGSDLTATTIAAACKAEEAQVWKDVDGILTADPRIVKAARPVEALNYEEALELAYFGAQVLHPRAMLPCMKTGTPVMVKNSYNVSAPGTRIGPGIHDRGKQVKNGKSPRTKDGAPIRAITFRRNVTLVDIVSSRMLGQYGFLAEVFSSFASRNISVDMVATSEVSVSLTLDTAYDLAAVKEALSKIASVEIKTGKAIVSIVGDIGRSSEILARAFRTCQLSGVSVQMVSQGASKVNVSFIVDDTEAAQVVRALHMDFFESEKL